MAATSFGYRSDFDELGVVVTPHASQEDHRAHDDDARDVDVLDAKLVPPALERPCHEARSVVDQVWNGEAQEVVRFDGILPSASTRLATIWKASRTICSTTDPKSPGVINAMADPNS